MSQASHKPKAEVTDPGPASPVRSILRPICSRGASQYYDPCSGCREGIKSEPGERVNVNH